MSTTIGGLMGYAEHQAALLRFPMDSVYRARLARSIKLELRKGVHPDDLKVAIKGLLERKLSPGLLSRKVEDIHKPRDWGATPPAQADPYEDFPEY